MKYTDAQEKVGDFADIKFQGQKVYHTTLNKSKSQFL